MKADRLGILSALLASACCLGPVLLVLLGLGSLGIGAVLGRYHWWFIGTALTLLVGAWRRYLKEAAGCRAASCAMARGKTTRAALLLASAVVAIFVGLNVYTYASPSRGASRRTALSGNEPLTSVVIPVQGMTCFTCELTVESSLKRLAGVETADAKVTAEAAYVRYDPTRVSVEELIEAINKTGYQASLPTQGRRQP